MTVFQTIALIVFAALGVLTLSAGMRGTRKRVVVFWLAVWSAGAVTVAWPKATVVIARFLGIGRGADLLLYVSVLAGLIGFFYVYTRFRRMDRQMTLLVRRLAVENAEPPTSGTIAEPGAAHGGKADPVTAAPLSDEVKTRLYLVIAAFNEAECIASVVREACASCPNVVVVDDGSADATAEEARAGGATVLAHRVNRGQGAALQTGISYALTQGAEYVVTYDADGQHDIADLPALLAPIVRGEFDICLGSRFLGTASNVPPIRRAVLGAAVVFTRVTARVKLTDTHNGYRAFSRRAAQRLDLHLDRMAHASEILDQVRASGLPYCEVPVRIRYTEYSLKKGQRSSAALRVALDYLIGKLLR